MDNLSSHRSVLVQQAIHLVGHRCIFRAPYYPVDSPIEHLFNTVQMALTLKMYEMRDPAQVKPEYLRIMRKVKCYATYFEHIGIMN